MKIWDRLPKKQYLSLAPWTWVQLESADPPGPFPFIAGVAPEVVASLHEAHGLLSSAIDTAISDVFSKRAPLDDPDRQRRLEDAYAEVISARPYLQQHIRCGRRPDDTFHWEFPTDSTKSATVINANNGSVVATIKLSGQAETGQADPSQTIWVDRTILSPDTPAPDFTGRTINARVNYLGAFVIATVTEQPPTGAADLSVGDFASAPLSLRPRFVEIQDWEGANG